MVLTFENELQLSINQRVLKQFSWSFDVKVVNLTKPRDYCLTIVEKDKISVFTASIKVFNNL
jgi:hypothetical protein